ncbi:hypothetical protein LINGRAHAP2_LOCUS17133 [Linum grandiflorum]|jgi:hypothetical protein
MSRS